MTDTETKESEKREGEIDERCIGRVTVEEIEVVERKKQRDTLFFNKMAELYNFEKQKIIKISCNTLYMELR